MLDIRKILPHRYPFLLIDKMIECQPNLFGKAIKNFTINESFFQGHFPEEAVVPGVIIVECCAQTIGIVCHGNRTNDSHFLSYLASVKEFNFRHKVVPGDQMLIEAKIVLTHQNFIQAKVKCYVGKQIVGDGSLTIAKTNRNLNKEREASCQNILNSVS